MTVFDQISEAVWAQHRERLATIVATAKRLRELLVYGEDVRQLLLQPEIEAAPGDIDFDNLERGSSEEAKIFGELWDQVYEKWTWFVKVLTEFEIETKAAYKSEFILRELRGGACGKGQKSPEHIYLWLPVFSFWCRAGGIVGFSEKGPLVRILNALHKEAGLPPPSLNSVRQAIRDFKKKGSPRK